MLQVKNNGGVTTVSFDPGSKLNIVVAPEVKKELARVAKEAGQKVVFDLSNLEYIDSSGVGALLSLLRQCRERNCALVLTQAQPSVMELFNLLQLQSIFQFQ